MRGLHQESEKHSKTFLIYEILSPVAARPHSSEEEIHLGAIHLPINVSASRRIFKHHRPLIHRFNLKLFSSLFSDIELKFPYRQVSVKRGEDVKNYYELNEEIGR